MGAGAFNCGKVGAGVPALPKLPDITENMGGVEIVIGQQSGQLTVGDQAGWYGMTLDKDYVLIAPAAKVDIETEVLGHPDKNHLTEKDISSISQWYLLEQMRRVNSGAGHKPIWEDVGSTVRTPSCFEVIAYDAQIGADAGPLFGDQEAWYGLFTAEKIKPARQHDRWASGGQHGLRTKSFMEIARDKLRAGLGLVNGWYMKLLTGSSEMPDPKEVLAKEAILTYRAPYVGGIKAGEQAERWAKGGGVQDTQHERWAKGGGVKKPE